MVKAQNELIRRTLSAGGYLQVNKFLARTLGYEAAVMLAELIWQHELATQNGKLDDKNFFPVYRAAIEQQTTLTPKLQRKGEDALESVKILETKLNDMGNQLFYKIDTERVEKYLRS